MRTFILVAIILVLFGWAFLESQERIQRCEARQCSFGKQARQTREGCLCVELPQ